MLGYAFYVQVEMTIEQLNIWVWNSVEMSGMTILIGASSAYRLYTI